MMKTYEYVTTCNQNEEVEITRVSFYTSPMYNLSKYPPVYKNMY